MRGLKRRLVPGEREIESLGTVTLTTHRVIAFEQRGRRWASTAILLRHVASTTVSTRLWWVRLVVASAGGRIVLRLGREDAQRARRMADAIDAAASKIGLDAGLDPATDRR